MQVDGEPRHLLAAVGRSHLISPGGRIVSYIALWCPHRWTSFVQPQLISLLWQVVSTALLWTFHELQAFLCGHIPRVYENI